MPGSIQMSSTLLPAPWQRRGVLLLKQPRTPEKTCAVALRGGRGGDCSDSGLVLKGEMFEASLLPPRGSCQSEAHLHTTLLLNG